MNHIPLDKESEKAFLDIVDRIVENVYNINPMSVEDKTMYVITNHDFIKHGSKDSHISFNNTIANNHPYIDIQTISDNDSGSVIQKCTKNALHEYAKRESLKELRRRQYTQKQTSYEEWYKSINR